MSYECEESLWTSIFSFDAITAHSLFLLGQSDESLLYYYLRLNIVEMENKERQGPRRRRLLEKMGTHQSQVYLRSPGVPLRKTSSWLSI